MANTFFACSWQAISPHFTASGTPVNDTSFWHEYSQGFIVGEPEGDIWNITVDQLSTIWIATVAWLK
ncbi:MAG: hypothetical protein M3R50_11010 [Bacteroidota bacterium]|nr:hypothetical protein [Bacteroidota bacterium]